MFNDTHFVQLFMYYFHIRGKFVVSIDYTEDGFHLESGFRLSSQKLVITFNLDSRNNCLHHTSKLSMYPSLETKIVATLSLHLFGVFFKMKLAPEIWCILLSIKQLRMKKIRKGNFT